MLVMLGLGGISWGATPQTAAGANHTIFLQADGTLWGTGLNLFGQVGDGSFTTRKQAVQIGSGSSWKAVSAGAEHNLALRSDGTLWAWGRGNSGQLGRLVNGNPPASQNSPVQIGADRDWVAVAASGGASSYALKGDGTLWAWGANGSGQLGNGQSSQQNTPAQVTTPSGRKFTALAAGRDHALALAADGSLWSFGLNSFGQLGDSSNNQRLTPVQVLSANQLDNDWKAIAAGDFHSAALKSDGTLWTWGGNGSGQLGLGSTGAQNTPIQVGTDSDWSAVAAGSLHTLALKRSGSLWACGDNRSGQLGNNLTSAQNTPVLVGASSPLGDVVSISGGELHSLAIKANGEIYAWGDNGTGQFGNGGNSGALAPLLVAEGLPGWVAGEPGNQFTIARRSNGTLWGWGNNSNGELGDGSGTQRKAPVAIGSQDNWASHSAGFSHTVALRADGTLWSWGDNSSGQLGDNTRDPSLLPIQIIHSQPDSAANDWAAVAAGDFHNLALKADGSLWSWGDNSSGQLGDKSTIARLKPQSILTGNPGNFDRNWVAVAAGGSHSLALQSDGTLWAWGDNTIGQLGVAVGSQISTPTQVFTFTPPAGNLGFNSNWKSIGAGLGHSLALQSNGTLWAWGSNFSGQLGTGDKLDKTAPVQVQNAGAAPYVALAAGDAHSVARQADGTLWSWGRSASGQLGNNVSDPALFSQLSNPSPVQEFLAGSDWVDSAIGGSHSMGLKADGTLWAWGSNFSGQLGDGSTTDRSIPTSLLEGFVTVAPSLAFDPVMVAGTPPTLPLTIANHANGALFVTGASIAGGNSGLFSITAGTCSGSTSFTVPAKGSCQLNLTFATSAPAGAKTAQLVLDSNDPVRPQVTVALSATSVAPFIVSTSVNPGIGGSISPQGQVAVLPGSSPVFSIAAAANYHTTDVTVNGVSSGAVSSVTLASINGDATIAASFALNSFTLSYSSDGNGTLDLSAPQLINFGGNAATVTATPALGYHFVNWTDALGAVAGTSPALSITNVSAAHSYRANFALDTFTVSVSSDSKGSVSPSGSASVGYGTNQTFTFTPNPGYHVVKVWVDGVSQGAPASYTLNNVTGNGHTVKVMFIPDGDLNDDGVVDVADALKALRLAVGLATPTATELLHGDVAPLGAGGIPVPDGQITVAEALLILRKSVGLTSGF
jgi:alpha-tubulin suppressor-like RCC1 family protein